MCADKVCETQITAPRAGLWSDAAALAEIASQIFPGKSSADRVKLVASWVRPFSQGWHVTIDRDEQELHLVAKRVLTDLDNSWSMPNAAGKWSERRALEATAVGLATVPDCHVPRVFGSGSHGLLITSYVAGQSLNVQLASARHWASSADQSRTCSHFERLGRWLATFQRTAWPPDAPRSEWTQWVSLWEQRLTSLQATACPLDGGIVRRLRQRMLQSAGDAETIWVPCHGDFGPWNVIVDDNHCTVIDFYCARLGPIDLDPLNVLTLLEDLNGGSLTLNARRLRDIGEAFLSGYGRELDTESRAYHICRVYQTTCRLLDAATAPCRGVRRWLRARAMRRLREELERLATG